MELTTTYLGLPLKNPVVGSASSLWDKLDNIRSAEEAGLSAVVLHSLFEEQISHERYELQHRLTEHTESHAESLTYFPEAGDFVLGPEEYLEHIRKAKQAVKIPIIASLNGHSLGGWTEYAKLMQQAGADALELNIYFLATDTALTGQEVEKTYLDILKAVKSCVSIPVAVKLGPWFSAMGNMAKSLADAGADGLVLFNRFYQPDIDLENLEVVPNVVLSTPLSMRLPLRWIAILRGNVKAYLAATGGIHQAGDALKVLLAGADVTMLCSTLFRNGIPHAKTILSDMKMWMEMHEYDSVRQLCGSMSHKAVDNPAAFERANYMKALQGFGLK
ncbi:MAG TPA: dihydroorotate dehydrogenase-like protein [Elusimicrobiota bacterium]|nr:dihydroorotate dehydrogenase-like protein [Elusimicrobiota bacterium]